MTFLNDAFDRILDPSRSRSADVKVPFGWNIVRIRVRIRILASVLNRVRKELRR